MAFLTVTVRAGHALIAPDGGKPLAARNRGSAGRGAGKLQDRLRVISGWPVISPTRLFSTDSPKTF